MDVDFDAQHVHVLQELEVPVLLHSLLRQFDPSTFDRIALAGLPNLEIRGVQDDSRRVRAGDLFVARAGTHTDGRQFAADAQARGAVAIITSEAIPGVSITQIRIDHPAAAARLAHLFLGDPTRKVRPLAVTGTNGKTTTAYLIRHILRKYKHQCGMVGTVEIDNGRTTVESTMTTPGAVELAELFGSMRDNGCTACAIETSSHALHQHRTGGMHFAGAGFTNLTGDHLDYHKDMADYAAAKAMLFEGLAAEAVAVINATDPWADRMIQDCPARLIRFAVGSSKGDYTARDISVTAQGTNFILHTPDGNAQVSMKLIGRHNIENALCAAGLVGEAMGLSVHQIATGLADATGAPGRLESVACEQPFAVLVDYAHTDDALKNVLSALRPLTSGKLRVVFGCGGNRDKTKRPRMAQTANALADAIYITSDNPRKEDPHAILNDITSGLPASNKCVLIEADRRAAIERVIADAQPQDVVLIAGKGHEDYQIIGETKHHFDDVEECERVLKMKV